MLQCQNRADTMANEVYHSAVVPLISPALDLDNYNLVAYRIYYDTEYMTRSGLSASILFDSIGFGLYCILSCCSVVVCVLLFFL